MKRSLVLLLLGALSSPAALVHFELSPPGTDTAIGLSPSNEVQVAAKSTGSGDAISSGIILDTDSSTLQVAIGYGSAAGFTDLTGAATAMHIHGPAGPGTNASVLIPLTTYNFPASDPAQGGVIYANVTVPASDLADLLNGLNYVNIHTVEYPGGEIRGQLIPVSTNNQPPLVSCPPAATVECGEPAGLKAVVSDPDGDTLTLVWTLDGAQVQTNKVPATSPPAPVEVPFRDPLPLGTNVLAIMVTDSMGLSASCSTEIIVVDTTPPILSGVWAYPAALWPPNHKLVQVQIHARATDSCGRASWKIIGVESNEPVNGPGDGNTSPDWVITGDHTVQLRAERSGTGNGRIYTITVQATDESGNVSRRQSVMVTVPKSQGRNTSFTRQPSQLRTRRE